MKKLILVLFFLVISLYLVNAADVDLIYPYDGMTNTTSRDINFQCSSSLPNIVNITLYHDIGGSLTETYTTTGNSLAYLQQNIPNGNYQWYCTARDSSNTQFTSSTYDFSIQVSNVTFTGTIPNINFSEDTNLTNAINLANYFTNAISYGAQGNSNINIQISAQGIVSLYPIENWFGSELIRFYSGNVYSNYVNITVDNVNDAPVLKEDINNLVISYNTNYNLDLSDYFEDFNENDLTYTYTTLSHFTITINNDRAIISPEQNWIGTEYVVFTASDSLYNVSSNNFSIEVSSASNIPKIEEFYPPSIPQINISQTQIFNITYSGTGGLPISILWFLNNNQVSTNSYYEFTPTQAGVYNITVFISNANGQDSVSWIFEIFNQTGLNDEYICGNGIEDPGETCDNCPEDVECKGEFNFSLSSIPWESVLIVIIIIVITLVILEIIEKRRKERIDPRLLYQVRKEFKELKKNPEYWIKKYIRETLKKDFSKEDIIKECKSKGWNEELIEQLVDDIFKEDQEKD